MSYDDIKWNACAYMFIKDWGLHDTDLSGGDIDVCDGRPLVVADDAYRHSSSRATYSNQAITSP